MFKILKGTGYDANSRLRSITQASLNPVTLDYDAADRRTRLTLPNGVSTDYLYDPGSRLTALRYRNARGPLGDLTYQYDATGNRIAVGGAWARSLLPDPVPSATYDAANRQLRFGGQSMTFDANGNLASLGDGVGSQTFTWDARDRLRAVTGLDGSASFAYDAFGRRAQRTVNGLLTQFHYDGLDITREIGGGGEASYLRTLAIDEPLARTQDTFFLADALGSTVALTPRDGSPATAYTYEPYGRTVTQGLPNANPFQYTGREQDPTGLYHYRSRTYRPDLYRFISEDPIGLAGGSPNLYTYAANNPIVFTDPSGNILPVVVAATLLGAATGALSQEIGTIIGLGGWDAAVNNPAPVWDAMYRGAVSGGVSGGVGILSNPAVGGAVGAFVENVWTQIQGGASLSSVSWGQAGAAAGFGSAAGYIAGTIAPMAQAGFERTGNLLVRTIRTPLTYRIDIAEAWRSVPTMPDLLKAWGARLPISLSPPTVKGMLPKILGRRK